VRAAVDIFVDSSRAGGQDLDYTATGVTDAVESDVAHADVTRPNRALGLENPIRVGTHDDIEPTGNQLDPLGLVAQGDDGAALRGNDRWTSLRRGPERLGIPVSYWSRQATA
jgi:hypothetical protein